MRNNEEKRGSEFCFQIENEIPGGRVLVMEGAWRLTSHSPSLIHLRLVSVGV